MLRASILTSYIALTTLGCGGAERAGEPDAGAEGPSIHREGASAEFRWHQAAVIASGFHEVQRAGRLTTIEVLDDGSARISIELSDVRSHLNGHPTAVHPEAAELRFVSARGGGVAGSMSVIGEARSGERFVAGLLPLAWPPSGEWPPATTGAQTIAMTIAGAENALEYRRRAGAPSGIEWIVLSGHVRVFRNPTGANRARLGALLARAETLDASARLAMGSPDAPHGGVEVELRIGAGLELPERAPGGLLACADAVRALRARLDAAPLPPFVLNRPLDDEMLSDDSAEGVGAGVLLDLRATDQRSPLTSLFEGLDPALPDRDVAALAVRVGERVEAAQEAMQLLAALTGLASDAIESAPVYLILDPDVAARRARALGAALRRGGREPRVVVRRPTTGPREGMLRGSLWPIAELLGERSTECPFVANAVSELATRDVVASPGWVRAVVAGGIGSCGCDEILAGELSREVLRWSDPSLQSWGYAPIDLDASAEGSVADRYAGGGGN